jgi:hypothetical protein
LALNNPTALQRSLKRKLSGSLGGGSSSRDDGATTTAQPTPNQNVSLLRNRLFTATASTPAEPTTKINCSSSVLLSPSPVHQNVNPFMSRY